MNKNYKGKEYPIEDAHPAANVLPWNIDSEDFADLIESVKSGYDADKPILVQAGTELIIDGRRRALACTIANVDAESKQVDWTDEQIINYVRRHELSRRNLTDTQRAAAVTAFCDLYGTGDNQHTTHQKELVSQDTSSKKKLTTKEIAKESGASVETVKRIAKVKKTAPELLDHIREGKLDAVTAEKAASNLSPSQLKKVANADDPKAEAKKLLAKVEAKKEPPAAETPPSPTRGGNNFDFGANASPEQEAAQDDAAPEPDPLTDANAFVGEMESICRDIDQFVKRIKHLEKSKYAPCVMLASAISQIEAARRQIWVNRPTHDCSYCNGQEESCRSCKGTNRLSKDAHDRGKLAMGAAA